ncbi:muscle M-line assembly protein unc-89-like [Dasypus novemcinctus]|uniref:muscle M-line assembly protein unc-89-like n=1 Tax=Dasypus novemcinctus TaxID=9361 RepID=UPI00265DF5AA|nr:muscle M-line assembly protein unc-89-like [Dasypus novemcinctus]
MAAKRYASRILSTSSWPEYFKPSFTQKLTFKYVLEGEPVVFTCRLIACPTPEMTWFHNSRPIPTGLRRIINTESDLHHHCSSLEVKRVQDRDSGSYRLLAVNSEGSAESTASLLVIQKGQDEKYLEFLKRAEQTQENLEALVERREDRIKVDLRFTGSPFNKKQDVQQRGMMRTIRFNTSPGKKTDFIYDGEYLESKSDISRWVNIGESFLDEETKMKLQRLREARKILVEKKKLSLLDVPSEINSRPLRSEASHTEILFSREEMESRSKSELAENRRDNSTEDIIQNPPAFPNEVDQNVDYRKSPTVIQTTVDEEMLQTKIRMSQEAFLKESLPKDWLYDRTLENENTQTRGQIEETVTKTITGESYESVTNVHKNEEICKTPEKVSEVIIAHTRESLGSFVNIKENEEIDSERITMEDLREVQHSVSTNVDEFQTDQEEKHTKFFENLFQNHPQRCPPSFLQEIESQEVYEGDSCKFVCHFQGYPQPIVMWYNNDIPIPHNRGFITHTLENYSTLTFSSVLSQNEGSITCVLFNQYGTVKTTGTLKVKAKQRYDVGPMFHDYADEEEELALLFDQAKGIGPSLRQEGQTNLPIFKPNPTVPPSADTELLSFPVEIQITAATPTPEQDKEARESRTCVELEPEATPRDQATQSPKHKFVFSSDITNEPPKLLQEMPKHSRCREGDSVIFECLIAGEPQPLVTWFKNGTVLQQSQKFQFEEVNCSHRLYINDLNTQDSGKYICVAENNSGIAESVSYLTVEPVTHRKYGHLENIGGIYSKYSKGQQVQVQGESVKAHFYDYPATPLTPQSNIKEHFVRECFQSLEIIEQIDQKNEVHCTSSREKLPTFMHGTSRAIKINKPLRAELIKRQDEGKEGHVSEQKNLHGAEGTFVDNFSEVKEIGNDFGKFGGPEEENVQECTQSDYLPNIHFERTADSYLTKDSSVIGDEELGEERHYPGKKVKRRIAAFEKLQHVEKGVLEKRHTKKSFAIIPQRKFNERDFPLKQRESRLSETSCDLNVNIHQAEKMSPNVEPDSCNIGMNLKRYSSHTHKEFEGQEREQQKEIGLLDQSAVSERAGPEGPIAFDLKQSQTLTENADVKFQELDSGQPEETYFKLQHPASETTDSDNIVFVLKQMYSHIGDPTQGYQGQESRQQEEMHYKKEIPNLETLQSDIQNTSRNGQNSFFSNQEISFSQELPYRSMMEKSSSDENTLSLEKEVHHIQEQKSDILEIDLSLKSFSEEIHSESCALLQPLSADVEETASETNGSPANGDRSFISHLKKAASEKKLSEVCEMKEECPLELESGSFKGQDDERQGYVNITLAEQEGDPQEADITHRKLSLSQCFPFLMTEEQQNPKEQRNETLSDSRKEKSVEEIQVQNATSFSVSEGEKIETCFSENLSKFDDAYATEVIESETSLTQYLLTAGKHEVPETKDTKHKAKFIQSDSITAVEVEEVTFNTVYEYYNQQQESLGRPLSPESDISVDVASTSSEEISELDQFYTPPSSVEHFESPKSPDSYFTPSDTTKQFSASSGGETLERDRTPSENAAERYSTPSEGEVAERYSTPPGDTLERYSTPPGEALERYSTPPGESLERYSTPPGEALDRYSTPPGEALERYSTPSGGETAERYANPTGGPKPTGNFKMSPSKIEREDSMPRELFHTPTEERNSAYEMWHSDSFGTPNEAIEPKDNEMPPSFIEPLTKRKLFENTTLGFIVEVEGLPVPGVKWYRNKSLLEQDERIKIERVGNVCSLEISNIQKGEGGEYMCHAVNIIGEAKSFANVDIIPQEGGAVALPPPVTHQHVMEFDLENTTSSRTPSPQEIVLEVELSEKDVKEFEKQVKIVTVPEFTPDHKSMIVSLDVLPSNVVDPDMAARREEDRDLKIDLEVFEMPPRFIMPICDFKIPENSDAVFQCSVIGIPTPEVKWYKEYMCIEPDNVKYVISEEKGRHTLKIRNIGLSDCATYRCRAVNSVGEAICRGFLTMGDSDLFAVITKKSKVTLSSLKEELVLKSKYSDSFFEFQVVEGPPRFIKGLSDCFAPPGTAAYFQCLVRGSPRPTVYWYKDGKLVQGMRFSSEERGIGFHNLFITSLVKSDEGEYRCVATNKSGMAETCATLTLT